MSTIETLHQVVDQLPEEAQEQLLLYARQLLETTGNSPDKPTREREQQLEQLLLKRYASYKESGKKGRPLDEVIQEIKATHGL